MVRSGSRYAAAPARPPGLIGRTRAGAMRAQDKSREKTARRAGPVTRWTSVFTPICGAADLGKADARQPRGESTAVDAPYARADPQGRALAAACGHAARRNLCGGR
jgi:hypothetical protein